MGVCVRRRRLRQRYTGSEAARIAGVPVEISRTGYTGDLGYEIWVASDQALDVWDALITAGRAFDIQPAGMLALRPVFGRYSR